MARQFGHTWWGRAWVEALEQRAQLDPNRLPRGRTYARHDHVAGLEADRGEVRALVRGRRPEPYHVHLAVRPFDDGEWEQLLEAIAGRATHAAALLDGELVPEILDDATAAGVDLLPGPGDLHPRCSCPDWADPCKHAAAVCYLVSETLDDDPFTLLLLRGRSREEVLAGVRERRRMRRTQRPGRAQEPGSPSTAVASVYPGPDSPPPRVLAKDTWSAWLAMQSPEHDSALDRLALLAGVEPPRQTGEPPALAVPPPPESGVDPHELRQLAVDAADRAAAMLRGEQDGALNSDPAADLARRAATLVERPAELQRLATSSGTPLEQLAAFGRAWAAGGPEGVWVLNEPWDVTASNDEDVLAGLAEARRALRELWGVAPRRRANRLTAGNQQLRVAPSGNWYPFTKSGGAWMPAGPGHPDPAASLDLM